MHSTSSPYTTPTRRRLPAWLLPALLLIGFGGLFLLLLRDELMPAPAVQTVRAEYANPETPSEPQEARATLLFRATGWIIPDPLPTAATTFIAGQVAEVPVVEGELVQQGQLIARLDTREYELALAHAQGELEAAEARAAATDAALAEAEALLAALRERAENYARRHERMARLTSAAASEQQREDALHDFTEYQARLRAQEAALQIAGSSAAQARAQVRAARAACDQARLNLSRCAIPAPISGRIMQLSAVPGGRLSPGGETVDMSTAALLYDPKHIALAADVPLDQAGKLCVGQQVRISCDVFPDREFCGRVASIYGKADQTRNTIRCRVSIDDPDDMLRPDMQCRGAFYSEGSISSAPAPDESAASDLVRLPAEAIAADGSVWVVSPQGTLLKRRITREGDCVRGVLPGEPAVLNPSPSFTEGQRVRHEPHHLH